MKPLPQFSKWLVVLGVVPALAIFLMHLSSRQSAIEQELSRTQREIADLESSLKKAKTRADAAAKDEQPKDLFEDRKAQRQSELFQAIDALTPQQKTNPRPPTPTGSQGNVYFAELMNDPGYRQNVRAFFRQSVESRYGAWLQKIASPEVREKSVQLLVDLQTSDEQLAVQNRLELRNALGEEEHARFIAFSSKLNVRVSLVGLTRRFSYTQEPLSLEQVQRIVDELPKQNFPPGNNVVRPPLEDVLAPVRNVFSTRQWVEVQQYARDGGAIRP
jgi:hypothetical protein